MAKLEKGGNIEGGEEYNFDEHYDQVDALLREERGRDLAGDTEFVNWLEETAPSLWERAEPLYDLVATQQESPYESDTREHLEFMERKLVEDAFDRLRVESKGEIIVERSGEFLHVTLRNEGLDITLDQNEDGTWTIDGNPNLKVDNLNDAAFDMQLMQELLGNATDGTWHEPVGDEFIHEPFGITGMVGIEFTNGYTVFDSEGVNAYPISEDEAFVAHLNTRYREIKNIS